ncbi:GerAB/ArcD/ProY family transporter [Peribacillus huizhouensis]|uniref:Spore germination protein (Amino acid permease) n=1 Tax=Peribacillus huizhouensis TaxID=1501239 RepID=A0ABR6CMT0_9BACI|nr:GerAB/ArcD/ProY family transporter [Peribacillus huizhouensis]MBA9026214.1 spore germination protein (amino acid permease) [Peribacillus huizhouensis]
MINKNEQISPFLVFFLVLKVQMGIGVLGFQRIIIKSAGNDSWIAVILAGLLFSIVIWCMLTLLNLHKQNLMGIHTQLFGKVLGGILNIIWISYWLFMGIAVYRTYVEVVQAWMFPQINVLTFSIVFALLIYYTVSGGFQVITGICFLGVIIPSYLILTIFFPLEYTDFRNLLPVWNHSYKEIALATKNMSLSYLGISTLLMYFPLIKQQKKANKWAQLANIITTLSYLLLIIVSIGFYSENQISRYVWATLSFWSIVQVPFVERFEYIGIATWVIFILPNICLFIWAATKGASVLFNVAPNKITMLYLVILIVVSLSLKNRDQINTFLNYMSYTGFYLYTVYIPILLCLSFIMKKKEVMHEN